MSKCLVNKKELILLNSEFDICGTHIPFSEIKDYQIVQREYIYRPAYKEKSASFPFMKHKYEFAQMLPYAAILNDEDYKSAVKEAKTSSLKESVIKDLAVGIVSNITDKIKFKKYRCTNVSGRIFNVFLEDVPAVIIRDDGKISDVYKDDNLYPLLGEPIAPSIMIINALLITAKKKYIFYGNGIHLDNVEEAYNSLRCNMEIFKNDTIKQKMLEKSHSLELPKAIKKIISLPEKKKSVELVETDTEKMVETIYDNQDKFIT